MNKVFLVGRIANDINLQTTNAGIPYCRARVAVNRRYDTSDKADFIPLVAWRGNAEIMNQYTPKGSLVAIEGYINVSQYETRDGEIRQSIDVTVENIRALESREVRERRKSNSQEINLGANQTKYNNNANYKKPNFNERLSDEAKFGPSSQPLNNNQNSSESNTNHNFNFDFLEDDDE